MKSTIVLNGNIDETLVLNTNHIIAVDGGAKLLKKRNILPDIVIGDLDSIDKETIDFFKKQSVKIIEYPREKDETDCELAIKYALENGFKEIEIINFQGERIDMIFALYGLLKKFDANIYLNSEKLESAILKENNALEKEVKIGETWSFIPLCNATFTIEGFKYPFNGNMSIENPIGVSNETTAEKIKIHVEKGEVIYFRWKKKPL
ncbi:thiamine diphosphokinase [Thermosipho globiformans]|uniref:thiamine diphosphokinase n=1 Tax=Thermosipho globiformans TaxID=380685 RepID=UPI000F8D9C25|nr:thiamine diphosphokinase [Thermosipho globiformans]